MKTTTILAIMLFSMCSFAYDIPLKEDALKIVKAGCEAPSSTTEEARCFKNAIGQLVKEKEVTTLELVYSMCNAISSSSEESRCFKAALKNNKDKHVSLIYRTCDAISSSSEESRCFKSALNELK